MYKKESGQTDLAGPQSTEVADHNVTNGSKEKPNEAPSEKGKDKAKERVSKRSKKKEKDVSEKITETEKKKRLLGLPYDASLMGILLLIILGSMYVVCIFVDCLVQYNVIWSSAK